ALLAVDPGFQPERVLTGDVWLASRTYPDAARRGAFYDAALARLAAAPDVEAAGGVSRLPLAGGNSSRDVMVDGRTDSLQPDLRVASAGYFAALGIPLRAGRGFGAHERGVLVVNEVFARQAWPGQSPLGKHVGALLDGTKGEVVGVVGN